MLRTISFLALVFTALALVPYGAHLFSLPNKIGMTQEQYFIAQRAYDNWALVSLVLFPAMLFNIVLAYLLRGEHSAFYLAVAGCLCMATTARGVFHLDLSWQRRDEELDGRPGQLGVPAHAMGIFPRRQRGAGLRLVLPDDAGEPDAAPLSSLYFLSHHTTATTLLPVRRSSPLQPGLISKQPVWPQMIRGSYVATR